MSQAEESFTEYVRARFPSLFRAAFLLTGEAYAAEDLVQQTLIQVAARWERIAADGDPEPYVRMRAPDVLAGDLDDGGPGR